MQWKANLIQHKNEDRIAVYFENTPTLNARIKKIADAKWSNTMKVWHLPDTDENRKRFKLLENTANQNHEAISPTKVGWEC
ncbi:MAG: hypothetical protein RIQ33_2039 [Bacteroidota bacterium]|jgi:integrase/recombinase XerD